MNSTYLEFKRQSRSGLARVVGTHTDSRYEATTVFRIYEHNVIPGLFQTATYTAAMLTFWIGFLGAPNDLQEAVTTRMHRQRVLRRSGKRFAVILEEQALRTWFGTSQTQADQLDHLLTVMGFPTVSVGVIPLMTPRPGVASTGFWIFDDRLVAVETPTASIEVTRPHEVGLYARMFEMLASVAVYGTAARELIAAARDDLAPLLARD